MSAVVTIVGPMRSGTSALARYCHESGIRMGEHMLFPAPGGACEWEDVDLSVYCSRYLMAVPCPDPAEFFAQYTEHREALFQQWRALYETRAMLTWGVKAPMLAPLMPEWEDAVNALGYRVFLIATRRDTKQREASLRRLADKTRNDWRVHKVLCEVQERIEAGLASMRAPDLVVDAERLREKPRSVMREVMAWR